VAGYEENAVKPNDAARDANVAADQSLRAAQIAQREAKKTAAAKREIDERFPTDHELMVRALASQEQAAMLRIGPRRNRWRDLLEFEEQLVEIEQRRAALIEETGALHLRINNEPQRHTLALATWMEEGEQGERPLSQLLELQAELADRQAEYEALGERYNRVLVQRVEHVAKNRERFKRDVRKAKEQAAADYARLVDELEATRQELLDLRAEEVWAGLFPSEFLQQQPNTQPLVGAKKAIQEPLIPNVQTALIASGIFELLRADVGFCASVASVDQYAALEGKTAAALTGREATWQGDAKPDFFGPNFGASWAGTTEEAEQAKRIKGYTEFWSKRLRGEQ
jgi:hypothetical protein